MAPSWLSKLPIDTLKRVGNQQGLDWMLLAAIAQQESGGNIFAQRYEPAYSYFCDPMIYAKGLRCTVETERMGQAFSYGLFQVMGAVARERGHKGWFGELFQPQLNIEIGAKHLAYMIKRFDSVESGVSAYNQGNPRKDESGAFVNQKYVDSVFAWKLQITS